MVALCAELWQVFCEGSSFFCLILLSPCSLLIWHRCRAHLLQGQCEMISVLTNINTLPDPINKLLFVSRLALSQQNLATARQVQIYRGEKPAGVHCMFLRGAFPSVSHSKTECEEQSVFVSLGLCRNR